LQREQRGRLVDNNYQNVHGLPDTATTKVKISNSNAKYQIRLTPQNGRDFGRSPDLKIRKARGERSGLVIQIEF
jgi:hypothetical protein